MWASICKTKDLTFPKIMNTVYCDIDHKMCVWAQVFNSVVLKASRFNWSPLNSSFRTAPFSTDINGGNLKGLLVAKV